MIDLFGNAGPDTPAPAGNPLQLIESLQAPCYACRLGQTIDRNNTGLIVSGPVSAEVAVVGDTPDAEGAMNQARVPLSGNSLLVLRGWLEQLAKIASAEAKNNSPSVPSRALREEDIFQINVVQCRTQKGKKDAFRLPNRDEVASCFPRRALPVLQSLPNLRLVLAFGMTAAAALLGYDPEPTVKSHEGVWFGTDYLPNAAVICLNHPRDYTRDTEARKLGKMDTNLENLFREYFWGAEPKILPILKIRREQRNRILADQ